jgi:hypothetical protein
MCLVPVFQPAVAHPAILPANTSVAGHHNDRENRVTKNCYSAGGNSTRPSFASLNSAQAVNDDRLRVGLISAGIGIRIKLCPLIPATGVGWTWNEVT